MKQSIITISKDVKRYYDSKIESVWFELPEGKIRMPISEISAYRLGEKDENNIYPDISGGFDAKKLCIGNGEIILSRRLAILEAYKNINVGDIKIGIIKKIMGFGIFISLENGIEGLCHAKEVSNARMDDLTTFFEVGQEIRVKIIEKQTYYPYHVELSIKQAVLYPYVDLDEVVTARITRLLNDKSGAFAEINPLRLGIVDAIPGEFELDEKRVGEEIYVLIRGIRRKKREDGSEENVQLKLDYLGPCI